MLWLHGSMDDVQMPLSDRDVICKKTVCMYKDGLNLPPDPDQNVSNATSSERADVYVSQLLGTECRVVVKSS